MANPNSEIWGSPESWIPAKYFYCIGDGDPEIKAGIPKTANFADNNGTLAKGSQEGKTPVDQSIDLTICPCGQDPIFSAFGSIALFKNKQSAEDNKVPDTIIEQTTPCNWFLFDGTGAGLSTSDGHVRDTSNSQQRWAPNSDLQNNWNGYITPFTYWDLKSILVHIRVACITGYMSVGYPTSTWRTLDDWRQNHSSEKICDIKLSFCGFSQKTGTNITYTSNSDMSTGNFGGVGLLDSLDGIIDYAAFAFARETSLTLLGVLVDNYYNTASTFYMPCYNMFENMEYKALSSSSPDYGWCVWTEIPYSANNYEKIMQMVACFGIPFTDKNKDIFPIDYIDNDLYLPIIDDDGITHGEYTHGADNKNNDLYDKNSIRDKNYDPAKPVDPNQYSNITSFNTLDTNAALTKFYVLDKTNVEKLGDDLWTICADLSVDDYTDFEGKVKDEFLTSNPIDSIISLKRFPFDVPHTFSNTKVNVQLGKSEGTAQGYRTYNVVFGVDFKGIDIFPRFGNSFLDYSPYTSYELYIPFCGTIEINPGDILGHKLNLQLRIDLFTGSVIAYIMAGSLVIGTANGNCALDQVLSGTQSATVYSNIINGILTYNSIQDTRSNTLGELLYPTGWIKGAISPFSYTERFDQLNIQEQKQEADLTHIIAPTHKMGTASPMLAWIQEFNARLMIYYPEGNVINSAQPPSFIPAALASFGHLKGFATVSPGKVSSFQKIGQQCYLRGDILADVIPCTDNERKRIRAALADGVFLPALTE